MEDKKVMTEAAAFLADKELVMSSPMDGYIIPYSYLLTLLTDFSDSQTSPLKQELERSEEHGTELREELDWIYSQGDDEDHY